MDFAAPHVGFVVAAYAISTFVVVGLLVQVMARGMKLKQMLRDAKLNDPGSKDDAA